MWRFITHVSAPKTRTAYNTDLKNTPNTLGLAPSLTSILEKRAQLLRALRGFPTTAGQFSCNAFNIRTNYLNNATVSRELP